MSGTPVFDETQPYGTVSGLPGVAYAQGSHHFNGRKEYVSPEEFKAAEKPSRAEIEEAKEARKEALKEQFKAERAAGTSVTVVDTPPAAPKPASDPLVIDDKDQVDNVQLEDLHWTKVRKLVEEAGGQYTGKDEAIKFLKAL